MSCSVPAFWQLAQDSGLLTASRRRELARTWRAMKGASRTSSARTLAEWLAAEEVITRYQAKLLLAGQPGPFCFGDYRIAKRLRRGGLVDCFAAIHVPTQFPVTLRFVRGAAFGPGTDVDEARRLFEAAPMKWAPDNSTAATAPRPFPTTSRFVPFYEWVDCGAYQFGVFGRIEGKPLSDWLAERGTFDQVTARRIAAQVALALAPLHEEGHAHGGLRPDAIWLDTSPSDEHLSSGTRQSSGTQRTRENTSMRQESGDSCYVGGRVCILPQQLLGSWETLRGGKPWLDGTSDPKSLVVAQYKAPEAAGRYAQATPAADIYSLGCIFHALLAGGPPFRGDTVAEVLQQHATEPVPPLHDGSVNAIVARMLAKDPEDRPVDLRQVADELAALAGRERIHSAADNSQADRLADYLQWLRASRAMAVPAGGPMPVAIPVATAADALPAPLASALAHGATDEPIPPPPNGHALPSELAAGLSRTRRADRRLLIVALASAIVAAAGVFAWNGVHRDDDGDLHQAASVSSGAAAAISERDSGDSLDLARSAIEEQPIADDGQTLWASPTSGPPISAQYLPEGVEVILAVRLSELLAHPERERIVTAAGPSLGTLLRTLPETTGFDAAEIEQLIVGWGAAALSEMQEDGLPKPSYKVGIVLRLATGASLADLAGRLESAEIAQLEGHRVVVRDEKVFYVPPTENGRVVAVLQAKDAPSLVPDRGGPPLRRAIEQLLAHSDAVRHVTLVAPVHSILGDGRDVMGKHAGTLREPLQDLLGPKTQGLLISAHWGNDFFLELAAVAPAETPPLELRAFLQERLERLPRLVEDHVQSLQVRPYGRRIVARLPEMMRRLVAHTRSAAEADRAVFRCYLPVAAGHNLLMAGEIALAETHAGVAAVATPASGPPRSAKERLAKVTSLSFARDTLESALTLLAEDVGVPIVIRGQDLQVEGITKNQSFAIDVVDRPAREILVEILRLANSDKTATAADDPRQKLVYVIQADAAGIETIVVTTRKAAADRGDDLPAEFRPK